MTSPDIPPSGRLTMRSRGYFFRVTDFGDLTLVWRIFKGIPPDARIVAVGIDKYPKQGGEGGWEDFWIEWVR